jgi:hypothetical protein
VANGMGRSVTRPVGNALLTAGALLEAPPLERVVELPVLGIRTRFATNSSQVLEAVEDSFGCWRGVAPDESSSATGSLNVRLVVYEDATMPHDAMAHAPVRHICPDATRLIIQSSHAVGISDPARREALGYVETSLVADRPHFRAAVLDALTYSLLSYFDRHPVHAAAVAEGDRVVLLAAPSGTGKSTIAYLAHQAGLVVVSDDRVWVQLEPELRIWGAPAPLRLLPEAAVMFRELGGSSVLEIDGKRKLSIDAGAGAMAADAREVAVCVMERGAAPASLARARPEELARALMEQLAPGFDRHPARQREVVRALTVRGGWRLRLSPSPSEALPLLRQMLVDGD